MDAWSTRTAAFTATLARVDNPLAIRTRTRRSMLRSLDDLRLASVPPGSSQRMPGVARGELPTSSGGDVNPFETVNFVTPQLAVGGRYFWAGRLRRAAVTHILSARLTPDDLPGFVCFNNPMEDDGADRPSEYWRRTVDFALEVLAERHHRIYVHCAAGKKPWTRPRLRHPPRSRPSTAAGPGDDPPGPTEINAPLLRQRRRRRPVTCSTTISTARRADLESV